MGEILILTSINGRLLTEKKVDLWLDANEISVTNKIFSDDRCSVEITFVDEERADMMADLLATCYSDCISISRPQTSAPFLDNFIDEERVPSPVHLSSLASVSSFSQRLARSDKKQEGEKIKLAVGRGREMDVDSSRMDQPIVQGEMNGVDDDTASISNSNRFLKIMSALLPRVSKLTIIPVARESLLHAIIHFERSNGRNDHRCVLSLKDICARRLLLQLGEDPDLYHTHLPSRLIRYVTHDYLTETNNAELMGDSTFLFCRDCSLNELDAPKCRRRKCLANRLQQVLEKLSSLIIPWENGQRFAVLETDETDEDQPVVFIQLTSTNHRSIASKQRHDNENDHQWLEEYFYLLDLLCVLHINIARE